MGMTGHFRARLRKSYGILRKLANALTFPQTEGMTAGRESAARAVVARRGKLGMTQQDLADRAGVDIKTIGNLESRGRWPIARTRAAIEGALGWPDGEMERLAARAQEKPPVPPDVVAALRRAYRDDPAAFGEAVGALEAIERERRAGGPSQPEQRAG